jgi:hypothetical protein
LSTDAAEARDGRLVALIDVHGARVGSRGFFLVTEPLEGEAAAGPHFDRAVVAREGIVKILDRSLMLVKRKIAQAARVERLGRVDR